MDWEKYKKELIGMGVGITTILGGVAYGQMPADNTPDVVVLGAESDKSAGQQDQNVLKVDLAGAVKKPGVYSLKFGSRIDDLLTEGGGLSVEADSDWVEKNLNRSEKVKDGAKVYIPLKQNNQETNSKIQTSTKDQNPNSKVNINEASATELDRLSGVGEVTAQKIIDGRPYGKIEDLRDKKIVGKSVYEKISDEISVW